LAVAAFGEDPERIAAPVARPQRLARHPGGAPPGIAGGAARTRFRLGRGVQRLLKLVLVTAGDGGERRGVVPHMVEAEMVVLAFAAMALGGAIFARRLAAFPIADMLDGRGLFLPARLDADGVEELGLQFHCA